jgi:hypothetical protein
VGQQSATSAPADGGALDQYSATQWISLRAPLKRDRVTSIMSTYDALGELTEWAFDPSINAELRFAASIRLADMHKVPQEMVVRSRNDVDAFILG